MSNASIGQIGHPYLDRASNRLKGFFTRLHQSSEEVRETLTNAISEQVNVSRITLRVLVMPGVSQEELRRVVVQQGAVRLTCEAVIPVRRKAIGWLAYFGWNHPRRLTRHSLMVRQEELLARVMKRSNGQRALPDGYQLRVSKRDGSCYSNKDLEALVWLYQQGFESYLVPLDEANLKGMLADNWVATIYHQARPVSAGMAEIAQFSCSGQELSIVELSEFVTHSQYQRRGLGHLTLQKLVAELRQDKIDAIFSESRLNHYGIMAIMWDAGLRPCGVLPQHCLISSSFREVEQEGEFGDLVVMALPNNY